MRIGMRNELFPLCVITVALPAAIGLVPSNGVAMGLSLPFLLFLPGYALLAALFPGRAEMSIARRMALSVGMSIAAVILVGIIINSVGWGITAGPVLYSVTSLVLSALTIAWVRRSKLPIEERPGVHLRLSLPFRVFRDSWRSMDVRNRVLSALLVVAVAGALTAVGYIVASPKAGDARTGFYLPGPSGQSVGYPREVSVGETVEVKVGINNHEQSSVEYRIETWIGGVLKGEVRSPRIANGEEWLGAVSFTPSVITEHTKVEFRLFRNGETDPWLEPLFLWIAVTEEPTEP